MDGDYLITLRNLQMLLSMEADGSGARWALASDSSAVGDGGAFDVYRFDAEGSKFWEPHAVVATAKDEFFLVDDGKSRPNCTGATTTCFSRAVGYRLDHAKKQASLFWEFEFPLRKGAGIANEEAEDLFNFDGGYVAKLDRDVISHLSGKTATVGIRPEDLVVAKDGKGLRWRHSWFPLDFFSEVFQGLSELLLSMILIFLGCGWTTLTVGEATEAVGALDPESLGTKRAAPEEASSIIRSSSSRSWLARSISALE